MKKLFLTAAIVATAFVFGQRIEQGGSQLNAGVGFSSGGWGLPIYLGYDYGVAKDISVGVVGTYSSQTVNWGTGSVKGTWIGLGLSGNYHFNTILKIPNNWDVYAGATLAYNSFKWDNTAYNVGSTSGVGFAGQVGARYFFTDNFGVNIEYGGGSVASGGKGGITYKF